MSTEFCIGGIFTESIGFGNLFAGYNTYGGYVPALERLLEDVDRIFILKGTPGCGKSTLMKRLFYRGKQLGAKTVPVRCSADSASFDGVIFPELGYAVADGTAPHVLEPQTPLIKDKIIDISADFDGDFAEKYGSSIIEAADKKKELYSKAYLSLAAAGNADAIMRSALQKVTGRERTERFTKSIIKNRTHGKATVLPCACFNCDGFTVSLPENAADITVIGDVFGSSELVLENAAKTCETNGVECLIIPSPVNTESVCALCIGEKAYVSGRYFVLDNARSINKKRFVDPIGYKNAKAELSRVKSVYERAINSAREYMIQAKQVHMKIESVYSLRADFAAADKAFVDLAKEIFGV